MGMRIFLVLTALSLLAQNPPSGAPVPSTPTVTPTKPPQIEPGTSQGAPNGVVQPPKFGLSEVESLKLSNLRLRRQLIQQQIDAANTLLANDLEVYVDQTLKAHGSPIGVTFDPNKFDWSVTLPPPQPPTKITSTPQQTENKQNKVAK